MKHGDAVQFSTLLVHDESRQRRDLFLDASLTRSFARSFRAIAPRENREKNGRQKVRGNEVHGSFPSNARHDSNAFRNVHARTFRQLKRKICFRGERPRGGRDFFALYSWFMRYGKAAGEREIRSRNIFSLSRAIRAALCVRRRFRRCTPRRERFIKSI